MKTFNVINYDFNSKCFVGYNIIPYLTQCYNEAEIKPTTIEEFKKFIKARSQYKWWSRCEYEIILLDWPNQKHYKKIDIYWQVMLNLDIISEILKNEVCK